MSNQANHKTNYIPVVAITVLLLILAGVCYSVFRQLNNPTQDNLITNPQNNSLPKPEKSEGLRGQFGIDKNINEGTIDDYLSRRDVVYRDMRMLKDPGNYEAIDGDSYLSGFVEGFEIVPFPYIVNVTDLPEPVGNTYTGPTLFTKNKNNTYTPNYTESITILEDLFPKDKVIFLMCGGGGYAGSMKDMLVQLGWDADKIYNVGGYWYYNGDHNVEVKTIRDGQTVYDFWKVPYHNIDFNAIHKK